MFKFLNFSLKFVIIFFLLIIFFALSTLWYFSIGLPDYKKLSDYQPPISSRVYSDNGKLIVNMQFKDYLCHTIDPEIVIIHSICRRQKFFSHPGVDAKESLEQH